MTNYIILRKDPDSPEREQWYDISPGATIRASSGKRALASLSLSEGDYVAVPVRSWKPLPVKVEQKTVVTVG